MQNFKYRVGISFSAGEPWLTFMYRKHKDMPKVKKDNTPDNKKTVKFSTN
jgi:uncharacterized membrane protein YkgB